MAKKKKYKKEQIEVANHFGHNPEEVYKEETKSFQDTPALDELLEVEEIAVEEAPPAEETPAEDIASLKTKLTGYLEKEDISEEDKTLAEELLARLEELETAMTNASEFLKEKETPTEEVTEEEVVVEETPAPADA